VSPTRYPNRPDQVPREPHFAIVKGSNHEDGYGGTSYHLTYEAFFNRADWEAEINRLEQERNFATPYVALDVRPARVERKVITTVAE